MRMNDWCRWRLLTTLIGRACLKKGGRIFWILNPLEVGRVLNHEPHHRLCRRLDDEPSETEWINYVHRPTIRINTRPLTTHTWLQWTHRYEGWPHRWFEPIDLPANTAVISSTFSVPVRHPTGAGRRSPTTWARGGWQLLVGSFSFYFFSFSVDLILCLLFVLNLTL